MSIGSETDTLMAKYRERYARFPVHRKFLTWATILKFMIGLAILRALIIAKIIKEPPIKQFAGEEAVDRFGYGAADGGHYLSAEDVRKFHADGFWGPFKVLERDEAQALYRTLKNKIMEGEIVYGAFAELTGERRKKVLESEGLREDLESRGWNRHFNIPELMDLLSRPQITQRIASILGRDVYLWRSQTFPIAPQTIGTALHQVTDFSSSTTGRELVPNTPVPASLINITAWTTLTDTDEDSSAMVFVRGSHKNNLFEHYGLNVPYYLAQSSLSAQWKLCFMRSVQNDPSARFDIVQVFSNEVIKELSPEIIDDEKIVTMKMKAGEAIIFTSRCIHGSHHNFVDRDRLAIGGRFTSSFVDIYPDDGEYREINHFLPLKPVLDKKYLKGVLVHSAEGTGSGMDAVAE
jgi:non-heme Fe2+,alpha-ketoglutarate-dependent halogenase